VPVVDQAIYVEGRKVEAPATLESTYEMLRAQMGWGGSACTDPTPMRSVGSLPSSASIPWTLDLVFRWRRWM
jgi:hypothetical protein